MTRALTLKKLALRVVKQRDREAAFVLGDAMMERGLDRIQTGRVRPVQFFVRSVTPSALTFGVRPSAFSSHRAIVQPGYETLYGVDRFARYGDKDPNTWGDIFSMWITPKRGTYQALVHAGVLPRSIRFHELVWHNMISSHLGYRLYLERIPKRRKKRQLTQLLEVVRHDEPWTEEDHFDEPKQESLPE